MARRRAPARPGRHRHRQVARPTWCRRCSTTSGSWSPPRPSRCSTSSSSATSRALVEAVERRCSAATRRTPCSRGAPTTPACTGSARACPTTRARWSRCPRARMGAKVLELRDVGRGGGRGGRHRRARQRAPAHRPGLAAGLGQPPRVPRRRASARSARSASPSGPASRPHALAPDRHQPLAARDRRDRGRADDPRVRRRWSSTRPTSWSPGSPRPPPTSCRVADVERARPAARSGTSTATEADDLADAGRRAARDAIDDAAPGRIDDAARRARPTRSRWSATPPAALPLGVPQGARRRRGRRRRAPRPRGMVAGGLRRPPSGWPPTLDADVLWLAEARRPAAGRGCASRRCRCGARCATSCSPTRPWCSPRATLDARRRLRRGGDVASGSSPPSGWSPIDGPAVERARRRRRCRGAGSTSARRSTTASRRSCTSPAHLPPPGPRRARRGPARRDRRAGRRRRGPHPRAVLVAGGPPRRRPRRSASGCRT